MNTDRLSQHAERDVVLEASHPCGDQQLAQRIGRWPLDVPFPATLRDTELMQVTGHGHSWFYILKGKGVFRFLEVRPALSAGGTLYSGHLVRQWSRGELGASKYFQSAAKRGLDVAPAAGPRRGRPRRVAPIEVHPSQSAAAPAGDATHQSGDGGR